MNTNHLFINFLSVYYLSEILLNDTLFLQTFI